MSIFKRISNDSDTLSWYIRVDSLGIIYADNGSIGGFFNKVNFSREVCRYVTNDSIHKTAGNDRIYFVEPPTPKLHEMAIVISVMFLDDYNEEINLRNKTYYSWGRSFADVNVKDFPLFKYLSEKEVTIIKTLLE